MRLRFEILGNLTSVTSVSVALCTCCCVLYVRVGFLSELVGLLWAGWWKQDVYSFIQLLSGTHTFRTTWLSHTGRCSLNRTYLHRHATTPRGNLNKTWCMHSLRHHAVECSKCDQGHRGHISCKLCWAKGLAIGLWPFNTMSDVVAVDVLLHCWHEQRTV